MRKEKRNERREGTQEGECCERKSNKKRRMKEKDLKIKRSRVKVS